MIIVNTHIKKSGFVSLMNEEKLAQAMLPSIRRLVCLSEVAARIISRINKNHGLPGKPTVRSSTMTGVEFHGL